MNTLTKQDVLKLLEKIRINVNIITTYGNIAFCEDCVSDSCGNCNYAANKTIDLIIAAIENF